MSPQDIIPHWVESAGEDCRAAQAMYTSGHYHWALFLWHLTLEKFFKALLTKQEKEIPHTHNLVLLAEMAGFQLTQKQKDELKEITTFNLEARYDDYKLAFYKKATQTYAVLWISLCTNWQQKIKKLL